MNTQDERFPSICTCQYTKRCDEDTKRITDVVRQYAAMSVKERLDAMNSAH